MIPGKPWKEEHMTPAPLGRHFLCMFSRPTASPATPRGPGAPAAPGGP